MPFAAQFQKMIQMAAQIVKRRAGRLRQERRVEVQSRCAAKIADGRNWSSVRLRGCGQTANESE